MLRSRSTFWSVLVKALTGCSCSCATLPLANIVAMQVTANNAAPRVMIPSRSGVPRVLPCPDRSASRRLHHGRHRLLLERFVNAGAVLALPLGDHAGRDRISDDVGGAAAHV